MLEQPASSKYASALMPCSRGEGAAMALYRTFHDGHGWDPSPAQTPSRKGL